MIISSTNYIICIIFCDRRTNVNIYLIYAQLLALGVLAPEYLIINSDVTTFNLNVKSIDNNAIWRITIGSHNSNLPNTITGIYMLGFSNKSFTYCTIIKIIEPTSGDHTITFVKANATDTYGTVTITFASSEYHYALVERISTNCA